MRLHTTHKTHAAPLIECGSCGPYRRNPISEYRDYSFRAEIDWIELKIRTLKPTNFQTVRNRLEAPYVETLDEGSGGAASEFYIKFYNLKNWQEIDRALEKLTYDHPLARSVEVTGIEIALDAYSKLHDREDLVAMVAKFYCGLTNPISVNQRITPGTKFSAKAIPSPAILLRKIRNGENIYIGNKDPKEDLGNPRSWMLQHFYLKQTDQKKPLPIEEHRARVEITLKDIALPHKLLDEWRSHQFSSEGIHFKFRKPKTGLTCLERSTFLGKSQYGAKRQKRSGPTRTIYSPLTLADVPLNNKAYDALRNLTNRLKRVR